MDSVVPFSDLYPIILPPNYVSPHWGGPIRSIADCAVHMSWLIQGEDRLRHYVTHEQAAQWDEQGIDWRTIAHNNISRLSLEGGFGDKRDEVGVAFIMVMLNDDGLGPSRLFVPHLFDDELGEDYCVAVPELTCAIAFRRILTTEQEADVAGAISGCFSAGTTPVSNRRFDAKEFWVR